jgi:hypothetical protein
MGLPKIRVRSRVPQLNAKREPRYGTPPKVAAKVQENKQLMLFHLRASKGNVAYACGKTGISRMTHYRWLRGDPDYAQTVDDIGEDLVDNMESLFISTTIKEKDLRSMRWFLERRGKDRGYGKPSVQQFDEDGNPVHSIGVQNNNIIMLREDVPAKSLGFALADILKNRPDLLEQAQPKKESGHQPYTLDVSAEDEQLEQWEDTDFDDDEG